MIITQNNKPIKSFKRHFTFKILPLKSQSFEWIVKHQKLLEHTHNDWPNDIHLKILKFLHYKIYILQLPVPIIGKAKDCEFAWIADWNISRKMSTTRFPNEWSIGNKITLRVRRPPVAGTLIAIGWGLIKNWGWFAICWRAEV